MAGVGTLIKQAEKYEARHRRAQTQLEAKEIEITSGGGAVKIKITGSGKFLSLALIPDFLKEDAKLVSDTALAAIQTPQNRPRPTTTRDGEGDVHLQDFRVDVVFPEICASPGVNSRPQKTSLPQSLPVHSNEGTELRHRVHGAKKRGKDRMDKIHEWVSRRATFHSVNFVLFCRNSRPFRGPVNRL